MLENATTETMAQTARDRRRDDRVAGPFDGFRVGALETPLNIFDLSRGGCFVNSMHEQTPGVRFVMKIDLPQVGLITVKAETLYRREGFGFAVRFVDLTDDTQDQLDQALGYLLEQPV